MITGVGSAVLEAYRRTTLAEALVLFLLCQYVVIGLGALGAAAWRRVRPRGRDALFGVSLGVVNIAFYYASLRSLDGGRPGAVVFPTIAAGTILASAGGAALLWGERYPRTTLAGMALAIMAIILINLPVTCG